MKKTIAISLILLGFLLAGGASAALKDWPNSPLNTKLTGDSLTNLIQYLYEWGISLGGFAAFLVLVIAGFQYLTSVGDPTKMKNARDRIRDAALGLILLLGSVLILNTINPQLTRLEEPRLPGPKDEDWGNFSFDFLTKPVPCKKIELFEGVNFETPSSFQLPHPIPEKGEYKNFGQKLMVNSIRFDDGYEEKGACQVTLYQLSDQQMNADYPSVPISSNTKDIGGTYGVNQFSSIRVKQIK